MILIDFTLKPGFLYLSLFFMPLGNGLTNPTIQAFASENVSKDEYGENPGLLQSAKSIGRILGEY